MSQLGPCGLETPRWSVAGQPAPTGGTASMAGLPGWRAKVWVEPPLLASGPSLGSALRPGQVVSGQLMLCPPSVTGPPPKGAVVQFPPVLFATMLFWIVRVPFEML
jgi:hypothetical protein